VLIERDGAAVVVDGRSLMYVIGSELDYVEDLTGSYFKVRNPNASSSCGCGTSFAIWAVLAIRSHMSAARAPFVGAAFWSVAGGARGSASTPLR
jgi:hypothetical protein